MINPKQKDQQFELPQKITEELLQNSSGFLNSFIGSIARINMVVLIVRTYCLLVLGSDIPIKVIIAPLLAVALDCFQKTVKQDKVEKFNAINAVFKILTSICFLEILNEHGGVYAPFYMITFSKVIFIFDQVQVFPQKYQQLQTVAIYAYLIFRNATDDYSYGFSITHLTIVIAGLACEYSCIMNFEGINQYLINKLLQIQKLETRWSTLLKHLKVGIATYSSVDKSLTFCNQAMLSIFSIDMTFLEELQNKLASVTMIQKEIQLKKEFPFADFLKDKFEQVLNNELREDSSFALKLKNSKKVIEISFQLCQDEERSILVMINEITSLKKLEKSKQIERMKTIYFCSVAHDLKTPINSIQATNYYLSHRFQEDKGVIRLVNVIQTSCQFLIRTIQDITDLSKIELKQFELEHSWFDMQDLISEVIEVMALPFEMKKISFQFLNLEQKHKTRTIYCDSKRIKQVLLNLIGNALKFTLQGGVTVSVKLGEIQDQARDEMVRPGGLLHEEEGVDGEERMLVFTVVDSGIGIKEENISQLFKLFGKVREQSDINKQGIGLGLTICKRLTEMLGGTIQVKSEFEKGTEFTFSVKCKIKVQQQDEDFKTFSTIFDEELDSCGKGVEQYLNGFLYEKSLLNKRQR